MDRLHDVVRIQAVHGRDVQHCTVLLHLSGGVEGTQTAKLNRHALCHQFGQTLGDLQQHTLDDGASVERAVIRHVLCEASQREGLLLVDLRIILTVGRRALDLVLSEINPHCNFLCCHFDLVLND